MPGGTNPNAWHNWYHVVSTTYGTWLRGDPRGFRTFHHRQHVQGDYRNPPPPGTYTPLFERSQATLNHPPVELSAPQRDVACRALAERLIQHGVEIVALAVAVNHAHLLARFPSLSPNDMGKLSASIIQDGRDPAPRHWLGLARRHASHALREIGLKPSSPVWAVRPRCVPIRDRSHQVNTARYIHGHLRIGAAVWYLGRFYPAR